MKTSEFIKKVNEMGYKIIVKIYSINVYCGNEILAKVDKNKPNRIDTFWDESIPNDVFYICVDYANTPIEKRKDEKRYYLYHPVKKSYFNYLVSTKEYCWNDPIEMADLQTKFTESEIKDHKFEDIMQLLVKEEVKC